MSLYPVATLKNNKFEIIVRQTNADKVVFIALPNFFDCPIAMAINIVSKTNAG